MTVRDLDTVLEMIKEDQSFVEVVYQYQNAASGETLYSVETKNSLGVTESSGFVSNPRIIYTKQGGWTAGVLTKEQERQNPTRQVCGGPGGPISGLNV